MKRSLNSIAAAIIAIGLSTAAVAETVGSVSTGFKLAGPNDKIAVEVFDDPDVEGVSCYVSRAITGGLGGMIGLAENTSDASIACRQTGNIRIVGTLSDGEQVFKKHSGWKFKSMQVVRFRDAKRNVLVYLVYSDKLIDGSPKNSISVVPMPR
jgi:CreA protein